MRFAHKLKPGHGDAELGAAPQGGAPDLADAVSSVLIRLDAVSKIYQVGTVELRALDRVNLTIRAGEFVAIMGPSGSGKSTMMNVLGCLDVPTDGSYFLDGADVTRLTDNELADVRNRKIGFVFQAYNLIPRTTAQRNVELPLVYASQRNRSTRARAALEQVGLGHRTKHLPSELSGGQQQRVAIARALVTDPTILLADEPTGNLDSASSEEVMKLLVALNDAGRTVVVITHEEDIARHAKRIIRLLDGRIVSDEPVAERRLSANQGADGGDELGVEHGGELEQ
jgi:putative ABC transport system ATP-binding protein